MPLLIGDDEVREVLTMDACLDALESAYKQEGLGTAASRNKSMFYITAQPGVTANYVSFEGAILDPPVFAVSIRAHVWEPGVLFKIPTVMLYSGETGELLALVHTAEVPSYRVGGTVGLAAREMARRDASVVGILGSSSMARGHVLAYAAVRSVEQFKVYSPNPEHRNAFADWVTRTTEVPAQALDNPEAVVRGSDIVAACTNSTVPIVKPEWLDTPGLFMTGVQTFGGGELEPEGLNRFDHFVTYLDDGTTHHPTSPQMPSHVSGNTEGAMAMFNVIPRHDKLTDVLLGRASGRTNDEENNFFYSGGTGVQLAAVSALVYKLARERGVGKEMPAEWAKWLM